MNRGLGVLYYCLQFRHCSPQIDQLYKKHLWLWWWISGSNQVPVSDQSASLHWIGNKYVLTSRQFRAAFWLITTKALVVDWISQTKSFSFLIGCGNIYHAPFYGLSRVLSHHHTEPILAVQGGILTDYNQMDSHILTSLVIYWIWRVVF